MAEIRIKKADLIGERQEYLVEMNEKEYQVSFSPSGNNTESLNLTKNEEELFNRAIALFKKNLPSESARVAEELISTPINQSESQLCSLWLFGENYATMFEPLLREKNTGEFAAADFNGDGLTDLTMFTTSSGTNVMMGAYDPYTLAKVPYLEFHCVDLDTTRKGVQEYLKPLDALFPPTSGGTFHSFLIKMVKTAGIDKSLIVGTILYNRFNSLTKNMTE